MNTSFNSLRISFKIWITVAFSAALTLCLLWIFDDNNFDVFILMFAGIASIVVSFPAFLILLLGLYPIKTLRIEVKNKINLFLLLQFAISTLYAIAGAGFEILRGVLGYSSSNSFLKTALILDVGLFACILIAHFINQKQIWAYLADDYSTSNGFQFFFLHDIEC